MWCDVENIIISIYFFLSIYVCVVGVDYGEVFGFWWYIDGGMFGECFIDLGIFFVFGIDDDN